MKKRGLILFIVTATLFVMCGLISYSAVVNISKNNTPNATKLTAKKLHEFYPGDISNVESIQITDGSSGERKTFTNKKQVDEWIRQVKDIEFVPDPNQEGRAGFLYSVSLSEKNEMKIGFTTNSLEGHYYIHNEDLKNRIHEFFISADSTRK